MRNTRRKQIHLLREQEEKLSSQITALEKELEILQNEHYSLLRELCKLETAEETKKFTRSITKINHENSIGVYLDRDTRTTPIIDSFVLSEKDFLVLRQMFRLEPSWKYVSLVIAKNKGNINFSYSGLTMTDLKKVAGNCVSRDYVSKMSESSRLYPLYSELLRVGKKVAIMDGPIRFEKPCILGGQTFNDQTGFGRIYCGEELVDKGKEYGSTTDFMIIGVWSGSQTDT